MLYGYKTPSDIFEDPKMAEINELLSTLHYYLAVYIVPS